MVLSQKKTLMKDEATGTQVVPTTVRPTVRPTMRPTMNPTGSPTTSPTTRNPTRSPTVRPTGSPTDVSCSRKKRVTLYKLCMDGSHGDGGADEEHKFKLNGKWLNKENMDLREGLCHDLNFRGVVIDEGDALEVGSVEDDFNNDDNFMAHEPAKSWYHETCDTYDLTVAIWNQPNEVSACWDSLTDLNLGYPPCSDWKKPNNDYFYRYFLKVEPYV